MEVRLLSLALYGPIRPHPTMKKETKHFIIGDIGEVPFLRSDRAKHISVRIDVRKGVTVTVPPRASFAQAREFMLSRVPWAKKHLARIMELRSNAQESGLPPVDRRRAGIILVARIEQLARQHGFRYNRLFIKNQRTLWGSCSTMNNINLNANLIRLPQELQDYVIVHELVHTRVKNHGAEFWQQLDRIVPKAKTLRRRLRQYKLGLS
jgi:predicted metal-dependent hydrolase